MKKKNLISHRSHWSFAKRNRSISTNQLIFSYCHVINIFIVTVNNNNDKTLEIFFSFRLIFSRDETGGGEKKLIN